MGEVLQLMDGTDEEAEWTERALCAQTDPEAFFPEKGARPGRPRRSACRATCVASVSTTPSRTTSASASGAGCPSVSGAG